MHSLKFCFNTLISAAILVIALTACQIPSVLETSPSQKIALEKLPPGLTFTELNLSPYRFKAISINPQLYEFAVAFNQPGNAAKSIKEIHQENNSIISFNGIFFSKDFKPLGLIISQKQQLSELKDSELSNGVFLIDEKLEPAILSLEQFQKIQPSKTHFALQNGPILIDPVTQENVINKNTGKKAGRTVLAITEDRQIIVLINHQELLQNNNPSLFELADLLKNHTEFKKMKITAALNLDGGGSTGLAIQDHYFPEIDKVQNIVLVKEKSP